MVWLAPFWHAFQLMLSILQSEAVSIDMICNIKNTVCLIFAPKCRNRVVATRISPCLSWMYPNLLWIPKQYSATDLLLNLSLPSLDTITCKRGCAKKCVKYNHAFLYENMRFQAPAHRRNPSTDQFEMFHDWLRQRSYRICQKWLESVDWGRPHK
jgi:hypothetical protein